MSPGEILRFLRDDVEAARRLRDAASISFDQIIFEAPSGIPYPDSVDRVTQASREYSRTHESVLKAVIRLNDYLVHGRIPQDLEEQSGRGPRKKPQVLRSKMPLEAGAKSP